MKTDLKKLSTSILFCITLIISSQLNAQTAGKNDPAFNPADVGFGWGDGANSNVNATAVQADDKIIICGEFSIYNEIKRRGIARLHKDGKLDTTFKVGAGINSVFYTIVIQNDGKIIIGGTFSSYDNTPRNCIVRLNQNGTIDTTFKIGSGVGSTLGNYPSVHTVRLQSDGKIIIGGYFNSFNGINKNSIARLNPDGSIDNMFNVGQGTNDTILSTAIQSDGKIIIGGKFTKYNATDRNCIARINEDGSLDTSFDPGVGPKSFFGGKYINAVALSNNKIIVGGRFSSYNDVSKYGLARLNADGTLDVSFNYIPSLFANEVKSIAIQGDNKILAGWYFRDINTSGKPRVTRVNDDGTEDKSFNAEKLGYGGAASIVLQKDGKIIMGEFYPSGNFQIRHNIVRLNADGTTDLNFNRGSGADGRVGICAIQPDKKIIIGGYFNMYNGKRVNNIVRLQVNGTIDTTFKTGSGIATTKVHPYAYGWLEAIAIQKDGKIVAAGSFDTYNGKAVNNIVRLHTDGTLDNSFNMGTGATGIDGNDFPKINAIVIQNDGKILIGGRFNIYNGKPANYVARLNNNGTLDTTFSSPMLSSYGINTLAVQNDGKILVGGGFETYNEMKINSIVRLNSDGTVDNSFNQGEGIKISFGYPELWTISIQANDKILIAGHFNSYNGTARNNIARLNKDGSLDLTFNPGTGAADVVFSSITQSNEKIIVAGRFTTYNEIKRSCIVRLNADGKVDNTFDPGAGAELSLLPVIYTVALQDNERIIIGGTFTSYNGAGRNRIARILAPVTAKIDEPEKNTNTEAVNIFPNPFDNQANLLFDDALSGTLKIVDVTGKQVKSINFTGKRAIIEKGELPPGIYFIQVNSRNELFTTKKIVIQ